MSTSDIDLAPYPPAEKPAGIAAVLVALAIMGGLALILSVVATFTNISQDEQRNEERIIADLTSCARGNAFRANLKQLAESNTEYVDQTLAGVLDLAEVEDEFRRLLDARLAPFRADTHSIIAVLTEPIECVDATPGADSLPTDKIPEGADPP